MQKREIERSDTPVVPHDEDSVSKCKTRRGVRRISVAIDTRWTDLRRWLHRRMFRRHDGPGIDYTRRLLWFTRHSWREFGLFLVLCGIGSTLSICSLSVDFPETQNLTFARLWKFLESFGTVTGIIPITLGILAALAPLSRLTRQADSIDEREIREPLDYDYAGPYTGWDRTTVGRGAGWLYSDRLDRWLFAYPRPRIKLKNKRGRWVPAVNGLKDLWVLWGGRSNSFNEWKVRLVSDLIYGISEVKVQRTDYAASMVTNYLSLRSLLHNNPPAIEFASTKLDGGRIPALSRSNCSNHLGGDLLVIGPGTVWLTLANKVNDVGYLRYHCSASGSIDWDSDRCGQKDLLSLIESGLRRELTEEARFSKQAASDGEFRIVRYGRATYAGGKPQFLALCRYPHTSPDQSGKKDNFTAEVLPIDFPTDPELVGLVAKLEEFERNAAYPFSKPLAICIELLRQLSKEKGNRDIVSWLTQDWNKTRTIHVVPVGLSVIDFVKTRGTPTTRRAFAIGSTSAEVDQTRGRLLAHANEATGFSLFETFRRGLLRDTTALRAMPDACAEWAWVREEGQDHNDDPAGATCILLANTTTEGLEAAIGVATYFAPEKGFYYLDGEIGPALDQLEPNQVYICRIPGLKPNAGLPSDIDTRLHAIGRAVSRAAAQAHSGNSAGGRIMFHQNKTYANMNLHVERLAQDTKSSLNQDGITNWSVSVVNAIPSGDGNWELNSVVIGE